MSLLQRFGYYFTGFSIGLVMLAFFFSGKRSSCSYFPNARVLKNLSKKELRFAHKDIDSVAATYIIKTGNVNFSESEPRLKPCGKFAVEGNYHNTKKRVIIIMCDSIATVEAVKNID